MNITVCPICGSSDFVQSAVIWPELAAEWELQPHEVAYVDQQQGFHCKVCSGNLRAMTLASAVLFAFQFHGTFQDWVSDCNLSVLEINEAQMLTPLLARIGGHLMGKYPDVDMQSLPYGDESFDLVIHSDTLEHIPDPVLALSECRRVLRPNGYLAFTIPIIVGRLSRSRTGLPPSYHGAPGTNAADHLVHSEFGSDFWEYTIRAGLNRVQIFTLLYPASMAILAQKVDLTPRVAGQR